MNDLFGPARSVVRQRYALISPSGFAPSLLPGWEKAQCRVLVSPALGARFTQVLATLDADGLCQGNTGSSQYFVHLLAGAASILVDDRRHRIEAGSCVYVPAGKDIQLKSSGPGTRVLVIQKEYRPVAGIPKPASSVSHERDVKPQPWPDNDGIRWQPLLPDQPAFDMALQLLTFNPGATWPVVATAPVEQSFTLLRGQGVFQLHGDWHPVQSGDLVWTAPFCPYWFAALGNTPATLLRYIESNRDPS